MLKLYLVSLLKFLLKISHACYKTKTCVKNVDVQNIVTMIWAINSSFIAHSFCSRYQNILHFIPWNSNKYVILNKCCLKIVTLFAVYLWTFFLNQQVYFLIYLNKARLPVAIMLSNIGSNINKYAKENWQHYRNWQWIALACREQTS